MTIPLEYAHQPRRRWRLALGVLALGLVVAAVIRVREPVRAWITPRIEDWQYARAFDAAAGALFVGDADLWSPSQGSADADALRALLDRRLAPSFRLSQGSKNVLFARRGNDGDEPWIAFGYIDDSGPEMQVFARNHRNRLGNIAGTGLKRTAADGQPVAAAPTVTPRSATLVGDVVTTRFDLDGVENEVEWVFAAVAAPATQPKIPTAGVACTITPKTGWMADGWHPNDVSAARSVGRPPDRELPTVPGTAGIAFLPDGRIAAVGTGAIGIIEPRTGSLQTRSIPELTSPGAVVFSPTGAWCFASIESGRGPVVGYLIHTLGEHPVRAVQMAGWTYVHFVDESTLLHRDALGTRLIDTRGHVTAIQGAGTEDYVIAGGTTAYSGDANGPGPVFVVRNGSPRLVMAHNDRNRLSISPDGRWVAAKSQWGMSLYDAANDLPAFAYAGDSAFYSYRSPIKWSADGTIVAVAGISHVYLWSIHEPRSAARVAHGRAGYSADVALSFNGPEMAASADGSGTIAFWNTRPLPAHPPATAPAR